MKNKINILMKVIVLFIAMQMLFGTYSFAASSADDFLGNISQQAKEFTSMSGNAVSTNTLTGMLAPVQIVSQIMFFIGIVVVLVLIIRLGFKLVTEPAERAEAKKSILPTLAVAVLIIGSYSIWSLIVNTFSTI